MKKVASIVILIILSLGVLAGCNSRGKEPVTSLLQLNEKGRVVGVMQGTIIGDLVRSSLPEAQISLFTTTADGIKYLKSGKVDAIAVDEPVARNMRKEDRSLHALNELLISQNYAFLLQKSDEGKALCAELDDYILTLKSDGTLTALQEKWFLSEDLTSVPSTEYRDLEPINGTISLALSHYPPFVLRNDELYEGYEVELIAMFCRDSGYALEIVDVDTNGAITSIISGKCDIGCGGFSVTEERKEKIKFSEPTYSGGTAILVLGDGAGEKIGFFESIKESFIKTFIRENRWKLYLEGIGNTLLITVSAIILGFAVGFFLFMLCRNGNRVANAIAKVFVYLISGMPVVVLLMVLYYVIFGTSSISNTTVSIIAFTIVFGANVFGILNDCVANVGKDQLEAAYALGYSNMRAFFRIILPQTRPQFIPAFKSSITELINGTAVVGYVAVQDLTAMGDIVRSRTYEAFFPLITVALIYFILAAALNIIVNGIEKLLDPKRRKKETILKGVKKQ